MSQKTKKYISTFKVFGLTLPRIKLVSADFVSNSLNNNTGQQKIAFFLNQKKSTNFW